MRRSKKWLATFLSTAMLVTSFSGFQVTTYATENTEVIQLTETESKSQKIYTIDDELPSAVDISADEYFPEVGDQSFNGNCGYWSSYYHNFTYAYNKKHGIKTTIETSHNPIFGFAFYGRSLESDQFIAMQIGYPTFGTLPLDHYGTNCFSPTKEVWEDAIKHRTAGFDDYKRFGSEDSVITGPDDPSLKQIKMLLANDLIVGIGTLSGKWNIAVIDEGKYKGESIIDRCDIEGLGGHGISFVGYDDDIWVDINHDGQKQKAEYGAFKMVNSWGPDWQNGGFIWVAYDALNPVSQAISSADQTRINNAIAAGTLKCKKVNNSDRMSFIWFETVSTLKLREKDTSGCICYITVNTGSRTEMRMSLTAIRKSDGTHTTWNFPSLVHDKDDYAWDGTKKATDATMAFDLDNLFEDISADKLEDYTWKATFGDTTKDDHSLVVKDVYIAADGVKKYATTVSKIPLNGNERTYDLKSVESGNFSDISIEEENKKNVIIYYSNSNFKDANIHYRVGNGTWTGVPGIQMCTDGSQDGYTWKYIINLGNESQLTTCFNNGNNSWDSNGEKNYIINKPGCYGIKNGSIVELQEFVEIPAEDITIDKESVELFEEEQSTITATITPVEATDKTVIWKSSDESVVTVNNGVITGVKAGNATITATTSNGLSKDVKVIVKVNPNVVKPISIKVLPMELALTKGDTYTLKAIVEPANVTNKMVKWTSANDKVATVNSQGIVTAVGKGSVEISASTSNGINTKVKVIVEEIAEEFPTLESGVYFEKPSGWGSTIYAYMWTEDKGSVKQLLGAWPGTKINIIEDNIYGISTTADEENTMIIFSDGKNQTKDLKFYKNGYYNQNGYVEPLKSNGKVYVKCVDEDGNVLLIKSMTGEVGSTYNTQAVEIEGYKLTTTPTNAIGKYTKEDIVVTYVYKTTTTKLELQGELIVNGSKTNQIVTVGDSVLLEAKATGGSENYTYTYKVYNGSKWFTLKSSSTATTFTDTVTSTGYKKYVVVVEDSQGAVVDSNKITVTVNSGKDLSGTITINGSKENQFVKIGDEITLKVTAIGGTGKYTYIYKAYNGSKWITLKNSTTDMSYTDILTNAGYKKYVVVVKDSTGRTVDSNKITVTATTDGVLSGVLKINGTTSNKTVNVGSSVTLNVITTGGSGDYTYTYKAYNGSKWITLKSASNVASYTDMFTSAGYKKYVVVIKDSTGRIVDSNKITVTAISGEVLSGVLKINGSTSSMTFREGDTIKLSATATGGSGNYLYSYKMYDGSKWITLQNFSAKASYQHILNVKGNMRYVVVVKDSNGMTIDSNKINVVVY